MGISIPLLGGKKPSGFEKGKCWLVFAFVVDGLVGEGGVLVSFSGMENVIG